MGNWNARIVLHNRRLHRTGPSVALQQRPQTPGQQQQSTLDQVQQVGKWRVSDPKPKARRTRDDGWRGVTFEQNRKAHAEQPKGNGAMSGGMLIGAQLFRGLGDGVGFHNQCPCLIAGRFGDGRSF